MQNLKEVEVGRLCLVLYPPDGVQGNNADNISLTVCGGELCRVVTATVHSKDGVSHLEAKGAHAVEPAAIASCVLNSTLLIGDAEECTTATDYLRSEQVRTSSLFTLQPPGYMEPFAPLLCHISEAYFTGPYVMTNGNWRRSTLRPQQLQDFQVAGWQIIKEHLVHAPGGQVTKRVAFNAQLSDLYNTGCTPSQELRAFLAAASKWAAAKKIYFGPLIAGPGFQTDEQKALARRAAAAAGAAGAAAGAAGGGDAAQQRPPAAAAPRQIEPPGQFSPARRNAPPFLPLLVPAVRFSSLAEYGDAVARALHAADLQYGVEYQAVKVDGWLYGVRRGESKDRVKQEIQQQHNAKDFWQQWQEEQQRRQAMRQNARHQAQRDAEHKRVNRQARPRQQPAKPPVEADDYCSSSSEEEDEDDRVVWKRRQTRKQAAAAAAAGDLQKSDLAAAARAAAAAGVPEYAGPAVDCPICFESTEGQAALQLGCDHVIHAGCLAQYLQTEEALHKDTNQYVCPMCKATAAAEGVHGGQQLPAGWEINSNHIAKLTVLGALTAEQEERINRQQIRRAVGAEHSCIHCNMLLDLEPGPANEPTAYAVKCGACNTQQCVACGQVWSREHARLTCAQMRARDSTTDSETRLMLADTVVCAGGCGHGITKDERHGDSCNVMRCQRCRVYTCFLCGDELDSSRFDVTDPHHREANQHYAVEGDPCYDALWMSRDEWLERLQAVQEEEEAVERGLAAEAEAIDAEDDNWLGGDDDAPEMPAAAAAMAQLQQPLVQQPGQGHARLRVPAVPPGEDLHAIAPMGQAAVPQPAAAPDAQQLQEQQRKQTLILIREAFAPGGPLRVITAEHLALLRVGQQQQQQGQQEQQQQQQGQQEQQEQADGVPAAAAAAAVPHVQQPEDVGVGLEVPHVPPGLLHVHMGQAVMPAPPAAVHGTQQLQEQQRLQLLLMLRDAFAKQHHVLTGEQAAILMATQQRYQQQKQADGVQGIVGGQMAAAAAGGAGDAVGGGPAIGVKRKRKVAQQHLQQQELEGADHQKQQQQQTEPEEAGQQYDASKSKSNIGRQLEVASPDKGGYKLRPKRQQQH